MPAAALVRNFVADFMQSARHIWANGPLADHVSAVASKMVCVLMAACYCCLKPASK